MKIYLLQFFLLIGLGLNLQAQIPSNPIRGKVTCNGTGVPGVVVTDGIDCVLTDQQGQYTLPPNRDLFIHSFRIFTENRTNNTFILSEAESGQARYLRLRIGKKSAR